MAGWRDPKWSLIQLPEGFSGYDRVPDGNVVGPRHQAHEDVEKFDRPGEQHHNDVNKSIDTAATKRQECCHPLLEDPEQSTRRPR
jgi:hypothetical protein